jgi:hypothetical protein
MEEITERFVVNFVSGSWEVEEDYQDLFAEEKLNVDYGMHK